MVKSPIPTWSDSLQCVRLCTLFAQPPDLGIHGAEDGLALIALLNEGAEDAEGVSAISDLSASAIRANERGVCRGQRQRVGHAQGRGVSPHRLHQTQDGDGLVAGDERSASG